MASAPGELAGKRILVTGSSRGIGRETAALLHRRGASVVVHARAASEHTVTLLAELGAIAGSAGSSRVALVTGELDGVAAAGSVWDAAVAAFGGIDVLVNNAGAWIASEIDSASEWQAGWDANLGLNLAAPAELCRRAILEYRANGGGVIVNLASRSAHRGDDAAHLAYGAAKGGLLALTKGIARGYGGDGVLAYAVAPGWVATDLAEGAIDEAVLDSLPLGEVTPARDVAEVIAFLASGRARHTTGATIDITGADYVR
ncbi:MULTISPECIES: SDR family NAD(P)-dependent oxidoreductase [unclassified Leucobacter]|uniref:SDR family NAD(P)-dependent oxidoreductase n=1 Tax=unclassified Leucobacter TaxID=2621730 RepID=UPI000621ACF4|nr:SDR family oxidoreductase [Leucobacter sp. Ag1]KKI16265.1 short-chain dehydrogenase [Leucobacter sp. Ag1]